ncbi:hypothetical protein PV08_05570 [Exophiala spinifera]|uniref:Beta-lactamase-related domain-containing protein n=1 Tax=Exophiala spinifera TaxID=91928 RepID=A0A0D2BWB7_9EURO|nr:uncharacterized protein PV08_05570 [Exophiala spinifera]KIW15524.1 hypothetical protein PV08_05570 [Exophiala spinifera]
MTVEGHCDARFAGLKAELERQLESGNELGASIVVNIDGTNVVDIWGGYASADHSRAWTKDTITNVWSSSKTVSALAVLVLISRGLVDPDAPLSKYWPEFGAGVETTTAKTPVLVRHILSHTSGHSGWRSPMTVERLYDLDLATSLLASQEPFWEPGTASGYHSISMGHLIGGLVRRVTGQSLGSFVAAEIAGPLGADWQLGARESDWARVADLLPPPPSSLDFSKLDPESATAKTFANPPLSAEMVHTPEWRAAELGAVNGHGNARSLARILSAVTLGGTVDGHRLLAPEVVERIFDVQADGVDVVVGVALCFGVGFGLAQGGTLTSVPFLPKGGKLCFWGGWGGSIVLMDLERKVTFSYVMNKMGDGIMGSEKTAAYVKAAYKALGVEGY